MLRTRSAWPIAAALLCHVSATARAEAITLDQALARAAERPAVKLAALDAEVARARIAGARLPAHNPELSLAAGPALGDEHSLEVEIGIAQTLELGGKRARRTEVATAEARVADLDRDRARTIARAEAWRAFERAQIARDRLATHREVAQLTAALVTAMEKSVAVGGATTLRLNVVRAEAGRARQDAAAAESDYEAELAALATAVGARADERLEPAGAAAALPALAKGEAEIVAAALAAHPDIAGAAAEANGARARIAAADAARVPDITVGVGYQYRQDPAAPHAILGTLSMALPIANRNQGERAAARIAARRAEVATAHVRAEVERRARLAYAGYRRAREVVDGLERDVTGRLDENLARAQDAFSRGGIDFLELTVMRRELIAARLAQLEARSSAIDAWAELTLATGGAP